MTKTLTGLTLAAGMALAQTKAPAPPVGSSVPVPDKVMIQILQQEVMQLRAEVDHIHNEDIEGIFRWLQYFKRVTDSFQGEGPAQKMEQRDRSGDKF